MKTINGKGGFFIKSQNSRPKYQGKQFNKGGEPKSFSFKSKNKQINVTQKFQQIPSGDFFIKPEVTKPSTTSPEKSSKKPFDKKLWRLKKYSNKYKLEQYEDKRKKHVLKEYYRQISDDKPKYDVQKIYEEEQSDNEVNDNENNLNSDITLSSQTQQEIVSIPEPNNSKTIKKRAFKKAHLEFERIKSEKQSKKEEFEKRKAEKEEALKEYKKKKAEKFKKLNKRTKKGQPIMKDRMEMLLEEIQNSLKQ